MTDFEITIPAGSRSAGKTFSLDPTDDTLDEDTETISVEGTSDSLSITKATINLTDDDDEPVLTIDGSSVEEGDSGSKTLTFTITLTPASGKEVSVDYADTTDGTATSATDYKKIAPDTIKFEAGDTSKTVNVAITGDELDEPNETIILRLSSPDNATFPKKDDGTAQTTLDGEGTITDDDEAPTVSVANASAVNEGNDPATTVNMEFTVTLSAASGQDITVPYTLGGSATTGSDYEDPDPKSIMIAAGSTGGTIVIAVKGDVIDEANETIEVTLSGPTNATVSTAEGAGEATGTITDDEATPTATLVLTPGNIAESGASNASTITATLSGASDEAVTLTVGASAVAPAVAGDFTLTSNTKLTIAAGATSSTGVITITAVDNKVDAANKSVTVSATASGGHGVANPANQTLTITDDDTRGVTVTGTSLRVAEQDDADTKSNREDQATYTVVLTSEPTATVVIAITAPDGVAVDHNSLTFTTTDWNTAQTVTVTAENDDIDNTGDARSVDIAHTVDAGASDYTDVTADKVAVTITDDDGPPTGITLTTDTPSIAEDAATKTVLVTATVNGTTTYAEDKTVSVVVGNDDDSAISGTDYASVTDFEITIPAGSRSAGKTFSLDPTDDTLDEDTETISVEGTSDSLSITKATINLTDDDDEPVLTIDGSSVEEGDSGSKTLTFTITLTPASGKEVSVDYADTTDGTATSATDYKKIAPDTIKFEAGDTSKTVNVAITGDELDEPNETIILRLSSPDNATFPKKDDGTAQTTLDGEGTITDDDEAPTVSVANASAVNEGNDPATTVNMEFTVTLSAASGQDITVPYTLGGSATTGSDYEDPDPKSIMIAAGSTGGTIVIAVKGDVIDEANETIEVTLSGPTNATVSTAEGAGEATGTITDDEATPTATLVLTPVNIAESGVSNASTITATLSGASDEAVTLTVGASAVAPAVAGDFTLTSNTKLTIAAGSKTSTGVVTLTAVDNKVDAANKSVTVSATASGGHGVANPANQTLTITDDDTRGVTVTGTSLRVDEQDDADTKSNREDQATYTVVLTSEPTATVVITITPEDGVSVDHNSLTFTTTDWNTAQTVTVTAENDNIDNKDDAREVDIAHTVVVGTSDYAGVTADKVAVTITDDDEAPSGITLTTDTPSIAEDAATKTVLVTATVNGTTTYAEDKTVSVVVGNDDDSAISGTDYASVTDFEITIPAGSRSAGKTFSLDPTDDTLDEDTETISVEGTSDSLSITKATINLTDDDDEPVLTIDGSSVEEGDSGSKTLTFTITLTPASGKEVSVDYADTTDGTATSATDYKKIAPDTIKFEAGDTSKTVNVAITGDELDEPNETIILRLSSPDNATFPKKDDGTAQTTLDGEGTITDDDEAPTVSVANASAVNEGNDPATTVNMEFTVTLSAASGQDITVPYTLGGSATTGSDYEDPDPKSIMMRRDQPVARL